MQFSGSNISRQSQNLVSAQVQIPLPACRRIAMVTTCKNGPAGNRLNAISFESHFINIIHLHQGIMLTFFQGLKSGPKILPQENISEFST